MPASPPLPIPTVFPDAPFAELLQQGSTNLRRAPYLSSALIIAIGLVSTQLGWNGVQPPRAALPARPADLLVEFRPPAA